MGGAETSRKKKRASTSSSQQLLSRGSSGSAAGCACGQLTLARWRVGSPYLALAAGWRSPGRRAVPRSVAGAPNWPTALPLTYWMGINSLLNVPLCSDSDPWSCGSPRELPWFHNRRIPHGSQRKKYMYAAPRVGLIGLLVKTKFPVAAGDSR